MCPPLPMEKCHQGEFSASETTKLSFHMRGAGGGDRSFWPSILDLALLIDIALTL